MQSIFNIKYSVLTDEHKWREEGFFKSFIAYASFTMFDFPYELYLAARFFFRRRGIINHLLSKYCLLHNIVCVSCNMVWQITYLRHLLSLGLLHGSHLLFYILLIAGWIQEEYIVMMHLLNI